MEAPRKTLATTTPYGFSSEWLTATPTIDGVLVFKSLLHDTDGVVLQLRRDGRGWYVSLTGFMAMRRATCPWHDKHPFEDGKCPECFDEVEVSEEVRCFGPVSQNKVYVQLGRHD